MLLLFRAKNMVNCALHIHADIPTNEMAAILYLINWIQYIGVETALRRYE